MNHKINLIFVFVIGLFLVIGCANSGSNNDVSTPKPKSFASTPTNSNYYNFAAGNDVKTVKPKTKKKVVKKSENLEMEGAPLQIERQLKTAPPTDDGYYHLGPRGGCFVWTSGGRKRYVDRSLCH